MSCGEVSLVPWQILKFRILLYSDMTFRYQLQCWLKDTLEMTKLLRANVGACYNKSKRVAITNNERSKLDIINKY